eukprot:scaffold110_cov315-Pavlova_lutheri.AAC.20
MAGEAWEGLGMASRRPRTISWTFPWDPRWRPRYTSWLDHPHDNGHTHVTTRFGDSRGTSLHASSSTRLLLHVGMAERRSHGNAARRGSTSTATNTPLEKKLPPDVVPHCPFYALGSSDGKPPSVLVSSRRERKGVEGRNESTWTWTMAAMATARAAMATAAKTRDRRCGRVGRSCTGQKRCRNVGRNRARPTDEERREQGKEREKDAQARSVEARLAAEAAALQFLEPSRLNLEEQLRLALSLLTSSAGIAGTVAVVLAFFAGLDPFGNFHWDVEDISIGLLWVIPLLLSDAFLMIPDWAALVEEEARNPFVPGLVPEPTTKRTKKKNKSPAWTGALGLVQSQYVLENPAKDLSVPIEVCIIAISHIAQEMLVRATILQGLSVWIKDRILETYMWLDEDTILNVGVLHTNPKSLSNLLALSLTLSAGIYTRRRALFGRKGFSKKDMEAMMEIKEEIEQRRQQKERVKQLTTGSSGQEDVRLPDAAGDDLQELESSAEGKTVVISSSAKEKMKKGALDPSEVKSSIEKVSRSIDTSLRLNALRDVLRWLTFSGAWFATGNLAATIAMSFLEDGLFSAYQRFGWTRLRNKRAKNLEVQLANVRASFAKDVDAAASEEGDGGEVKETSGSNETEESDPGVETEDADVGEE